MIKTAVNEYLEALNWRYATKKFDADRTLSEDQVEQLLEAVRLSASSYGLQPYKVLLVRDPEVRARLQPACWNQPQVTQASHLLVLASPTDFGGELIDTYLDEVAGSRGIPREGLSGYGDFMKSKLLGLSAREKSEWAARQAYIALGNLLAAAAFLQIDTCPMEGFVPQQVDEILGLPEKGLTATLIIPVGYRSGEDATQHARKVRRPAAEMIISV
jgi:nitroreductase